MRALIFDFDGVIIKSMEDHFAGWHHALMEYGIDMAPEELYLLEGVGTRDIAHQFTRRYNLPVDEASRLQKKKEIYYDQIKKVELYPHLIDLLNWATEKELKTALVTGRSRDRMIHSVESFGLNDYFDLFVTKDDVAQWKPSPEPFFLTAHILDVDPTECVVIENAPLGIRSAKSAGMQCIGLTTTLAPMFLKEADVVADNLSEVLDAVKRMY